MKWQNMGAAFNENAQEQNEYFVTDGSINVKILRQTFIVIIIYTYMIFPGGPMWFSWEKNLQLLLRKCRKVNLWYGFFKIAAYISWRMDTKNVTDGRYTKKISQRLLRCFYEFFLTSIVKKTLKQTKYWVVSNKQTIYTVQQ